MIFITVVVLFILLYIAWFKYKDLLCPAVIHNIFWILSFIILPTLDASDEVILGLYFFVIGGAIVFQLGFSLTNKYKFINSRKKINLVPGKKIIPNKFNIKIFIIFSFIFFIIGFWQYFRFLSGSNFNSWYSAITSANQNLELPFIFNYIKKVIQYSSLCLLIIYWYSDKIYRHNIKIYVLLEFVMASLCVISVPTRNNMLFFILPLIVIYMITHNISNRKILRIFVYALGLFLLYYYIVSIGKYWYNYYESDSTLKTLWNEIKIYLSGSLVALSHSIKNNSFTKYGGNSLRYFLRIYDVILGTSLAPELVQDFVQIGSVTTNVYTFYDWYLRDFGILYALLAQFIVGMIHGRVYSSVKRKRGMYWVYIFAMLMYPLVMQFFQDQYLSLLSTWIQIVLVGFFILRSKIFYIKCQE